MATRKRLALAGLGAIVFLSGLYVYQERREQAVEILVRKHGGEVDWGLGFVRCVRLREMSDSEFVLVARALRELWFLNALATGPVSDRALQELPTLTRLRWLWLSGPRVTDAGIPYISGLRGLEILTLDRTNITDLGMAHLESLKDLRDLDLARTQVGDAGLVHLRQMKKLDRLNLTLTNVTDEGLKEVARLPNLKFLNLWQTRITDAGLVHLRNLKNLKVVVLLETKVTEDGSRRASAAMPATIFVPELP